MKKEEKDLVLQQAAELANNLDSLKEESGKIDSNKHKQEPVEEIKYVSPAEDKPIEVVKHENKGNGFGWKDVLILLLGFTLSLALFQLFSQKYTDDHSTKATWKNVDVIDYINETKPEATVKKVSVVINSASYVDEMLSLNFTVENNNENTIRFLTSSFRIKLKDTNITPILEGTINENDVNTANGVNPGESVDITLNYDLDPSLLSGEEIVLKGIFITNLGTYDIEYQMPDFS